MAKLSEARRRDLAWMAQFEHVWVSIPPHKADSNLLFYQQSGYVKWTRYGWVVTDAGRAALGTAP